MKLFHCLFLAALVFFSAPSFALELSAKVDDVAGPGFQAKNLSARWNGQALEVAIGELSIAGKTWRDARLSCPDFRAERGVIECHRGELAGLPLRFTYHASEKRLEASLFPDTHENWDLSAQKTEQGWDGRLVLGNANPARLAAWLPAAWPRPSAGKVDGTLRFSAQGLESDLRFAGVGFSDAAGVHAGEKLGGKAVFLASPSGGEWRWKLQADWSEGQVFWQPFYFPRGGHHFSGQGSYGPRSLRVDRGTLTVAEVGTAQVAGAWTGGRLTEFDLKAPRMAMDGLYRVILKPLLAHSALSKLDAKGEADLVWRYRNDASQAFELTVRDGELVDQDKRFAFSGLNLYLPWAANQTRQGEFAFKQGRFYDLSLGALRVPVRMEDWRVTLPDVKLPVLDGQLTVNGFEAERKNGGWRWQFSGGLSSVSMEGLSHALGWPEMHGTLSGVVPRVSFDNRTVKVDGALLVRAFDGTTVVTNLALVEPLGIAPRLYADIDMRGLDLDLLTRTFSFGSITGRIDATVKGLELSAWRPVKFDAKIASSPGDYPRRISQRAVENISALGGAGAAAAIQRSFLRFLHQFSYNRIGVSCVLVNGVCAMDGVEASSYGYVIVKGGGIPAITVIGYNRHVGWDELLERLKRIGQSNTKPIVE